MTLAAFCLALAGFAALAVASHRLRPASIRTPGAVLVTRSGGVALIVLSLAAQLRVPPWGVGVVQWVGEITAAALIVVVTGAYARRCLPALTLLGAVVALSSVLLA